eukprot:12429420-Karenia_brevis.AAC.1
MKFEKGAEVPCKFARKLVSNWQVTFLSASLTFQVGGGLLAPQCAGIMESNFLQVARRLPKLKLFYASNLLQVALPPD